MDAIEARNILLQECICWQHNARQHYDDAMFHLSQYQDGCEANTYWYEEHMRYAAAFYRQAMVLLIALA